jgi:hypothetical protein
MLVRPTPLAARYPQGLFGQAAVLRRQRARREPTGALFRPALYRTTPGTEPRLPPALVIDPGVGMQNLQKLRDLRGDFEWSRRRTTPPSSFC